MDHSFMQINSLLATKVTDCPVNVLRAWGGISKVLTPVVEYSVHSALIYDLTVICEHNHFQFWLSLWSIPLRKKWINKTDYSYIYPLPYKILIFGFNQIDIG